MEHLLEGCNTANTSKLVLNLTPNTLRHDLRFGTVIKLQLTKYGGGTFTTPEW